MAKIVAPHPHSQEWLHRWNHMQEVYIPSREACYQIMFDALAYFFNLDEAGVDRPFLALDLACGTGSIAQRLLARFPAARAVAVDIDPVLMGLGQDVLGDLDGRLPLADLQADLDRLHLPITVQAETVQKGPIRATQVRVIADDSAHSRTLADIEALIHEAHLPDPVKTSALRIFRRLDEAEAHVHGVPIETIHLYEVGGLDAIADIVGAVVGLHRLDVGRILLSPLPMF